MDNIIESRPDGWVEDVIAAAQRIRIRVLEHCIRSDGGYLSQACSSADILSTLYMKTMRLGASEAPSVPLPFRGVPGTPGIECATGAAYNGPARPEFDRFFLSPAHYALALYATLIETGRLAENALEQFNSDGSSVEMIGAEHSPGFETMGGSLAQTLSQASGVAMARFRSGDAGKVYVFLSDGEFQEGQTWEAIQAMTFLGIGNLIAYVDVNGQQCDGEICRIMGIEPLDRRIEAFGGTAVVVDGHDPAALDAAASKGCPSKPHFVLCRTDPCRGIKIFENRKPKFHYLRFVSAEEKKTYEEFLAYHRDEGLKMGERS
jgi:transketolase